MLMTQPRLSFITRSMDFDGPNSTSIQYIGSATFVPIPAAAWLLLSGLGVALSFKQTRAR